MYSGEPTIRRVNTNTSKPMKKPITKLTKEKFPVAATQVKARMRFQTKAFMMSLPRLPECNQMYQIIVWQLQVQACTLALRITQIEL